MVVALDEHLRADPARIELQLKELHADITNGWEVSRLQIYTILPDQLTHLSCETESIPVSKFAYWGTELIKSRTILTRPSALLSVSLHGRDPSSRFGIFKQSQMDSLPFSLAQVIEGLDGDKKSKITLHHSETSKTIGTIVLKFDDFVYPKPTNMKDLPTDYSALPDACSINLAKALKSWMYFYPPIKPHAPPFVHVFTWSTLSSLWRYHHTPRSDDNRVVLIREGSSDPRNAGKPENLVLYDNCAEDILIQLKDLLVSIVLSPNFRTFSQDPLFVDVMLAVWRSVAYVEGVKEYHSQLTYIYARLWATADVARMQRNLFFLRFKTALLLQGQPVYTGEFDRHAIVGMLFELSRPELRSHQEEPFSRKQLQWRPFTAVLASPRGIEANYVWEVMEQLLKQCSQSSMRDEYRRAMTRLVQTADFVPNNIHIGYIAKHAELSSGGFGAVYSGENASGSAVAIKAPHTLSQFEYNLIVRNEIYLELVSWCTLSHPRILPFLGIANVSGAGRMCMISPLMTGTLLALCQSMPENTSRLQYVADIAEGMTYLHEERIVHGDLRAVNIFLDEFGRIKISDFGLSVFSAGGSKNYFSIRAGNVRWTAPENLAPEKYRDADELLGRLALEQPPSSNEPGLRTIARPTMQSDVYAFACVCLEVHTGYAPFHNLSDHEIEACVTRPRMERAQLPPNMAQHLKDLVGRCWADNPGQRPSFANIMNELMIHTQ